MHSDHFAEITPSSAFWRHRLALAAIRSDASAETLKEAFAAGAVQDEPAFVAFLLRNGLGPVWREALHVQALEDHVSAAALECLERSRLSSATTYLLQDAALRQLDRIFEVRGIAYVLIKGAHIRELVYAEPALRSSCDIDILVSFRQRAAAAQALIDSDFEYYREPSTISHEAIFTKAAVNIDLHWNILRPGRTRINIAEAFIGRRRRRGFFWGLSDSDTIFLMLTHPAFAKYLCSPNMELCRVADFIRWTESRTVDWDEVAALLDATGLKAAAWAVLCWFTELGVKTPDCFVSNIEPGAARAAYLRYWLEHDLPTRWLRWPLLVQFGLTLFLHDRYSDVARAMFGWLRARMLQTRAERELTKGFR